MAEQKNTVATADANTKQERRRQSVTPAAAQRRSEFNFWNLDRLDPPRK